VYESLFQSVFNAELKRFGINADGYMMHAAFELYRQCQRMERLSAIKIDDYARIVQSEYPRAAYLVKQLGKRLEYTFPEDDVRLDLFAAVLFFLIQSKISEEIQLHGLIVAHGESTATSIASVANSLCNTFVFEAFDMPMHTSVKTIVEKVIGYIDSIDTRQGLILLVDMGSLDQMYSSIKNNLRGELLIINNVSTSVAVDIGLKIKGLEPFKKIAEYARTGYQSKVQYFEGVAPGENVVISCISGLGIANKIKDIFLEFIDRDALDIVTMDYRSLKQALDNEENTDFINTKLIITTSDLKSRPGIKILNLSKVWQPKGEQLLYQGLHSSLMGNQFERLKAELLKLFSFEGVSSKLLFLNPEIVICEVTNVIEQYEKLYHLQLKSYKRFNLYLHISVMIERLMVGQTEQRDLSNMEISDEMKRFMAETRRIFTDIIKKYHIKVEDYEIILLHELLYS